MFELHIEFNNDSLVLDFTDGENLENVCHQLQKCQGFIHIYSEGQQHYVNTANILYFYVVQLHPTRTYGEEDF